MFKRFKNIKVRNLIIHIIVTLAYPALRAFRAESNKLTVFADALTIIAAILLIMGIFYSFYLHGDFDRTGYVFQRGLSKDAIFPDFDTYRKKNEERREDGFNYPLYLGIFYIVVCLILVYVFI